MTRRSPRLTFRALATACLLGAVPAAAPAAWTPAVELGTTDDVGSGISVAINISGAAFAGWTQHALGSGGGLGAAQFAYRPSEGVFGPAINPDPLAPEFPGPSGVDIVGRLSTNNAFASISALGDATALWMRSNDGVLEAASTTAGSFPAPQQLTTALTSDVRMDRNVGGDLAVVNHDGYLRARAQGSDWGPNDGFGGGTVREATVSVDTKGVALIAWIDQARRVKVRRYNTKTAAFTTPTRIVAADAAISPGPVSPSIGVGTDAAGRGVVVWRKTIAGKEVVRAAFLNANGTVRAPGVRSVSPLSRRAGEFDVAMAANGNATIAYTRRDSVIAGLAKGPVMISRRPPTALNWTAPASVAAGGAGIGLGAPSVAMAKTLTYVSWLNDDAAIDDKLQVARRVNSGPWTRTVLDPVVDVRGELPPEVHARGSWAIVGWREGNSLCCASYRTSIWDPTP